MWGDRDFKGGKVAYMANGTHNEFKPVAPRASKASGLQRSASFANSTRSTGGNSPRPVAMAAAAALGRSPNGKERPRAEVVGRWLAHAPAEASPLPKSASLLAVTPPRVSTA